MYLNIINNINNENNRKSKKFFYLQEEIKSEEKNDEEASNNQELYLKSYFSIFYGELTKNWINLRAESHIIE